MRIITTGLKNELGIELIDGRQSSALCCKGIQQFVGQGSMKWLERGHLGDNQKTQF
jgi:hypothetical protein